MANRLADRLKAARRRFFVGRTAQKTLFHSALSSDDPPFYVMYVYGPGGVGKTSLLHEFAYEAQQFGAEAVYLDMRNIEPAPDTFTSSLAQALGGAPQANPTDLLQSRGRKTVLLFDTCELLAPLEGWLRDTFLPELPATTVTVMAGRNAPSSAWSADPGWQSAAQPDAQREHDLSRPAHRAQRRAHQHCRFYTRPPARHFAGGRRARPTA